MNILNKLTLKHLKMNKKRTIVSIIGIILSTSLMVGIGLIFSSIREFFIESEIKDNGSYNASIKNVDLLSLNNIKNNSSIESFYYYYPIGYSIYEESTNDYKPYFYLAASSSRFLKELNLIDGRLPENDEEIVISNHIFEQGTGKYKIGDVLNLEYGNRYLDGEVITDNSGYDTEETFKVKGKKTYKIVGICERSSYEDFSSPGFFVFTKTKDVESESKNINLFLVYKNPSDSIKLSQMIYKNLGKSPSVYDDGVEYYDDLDYHYSLLNFYGVTKYDNQNDFIVRTLVTMLSVISVACIIVIYNSFAISVMERKKQFGLFSSIGATKKQIRKTVFFEAFIVGAIGIILGIIGAYIGIGTLSIVLNNLLKSQLEGFSFKLVTYPLFVIIPVLFIIAVIIISAYIPAKRASKISPIEVIRQNDDIKINKRKIRTSKIVEKIFGIEGTIALKNVKRNKKKYRITITSLFISIVTFIAFSSYLKYGTDVVNDYIMLPQYDISIYIRNPNSLSEQDNNLINQIKNDENVTKLIDFNERNFNIEHIKLKDYDDENVDSLRLKYEDTDYYLDTMNVIILDNDSFKSYIKKIGLNKEEPIILNKYMYADYNNYNRVVKNVKKLKENCNIKFNICRQDKLSEYENKMSSSDENYYHYGFAKDYYSSMCDYEISNFYFADDTPDLMNSLLTNQNLTIIVNKDIYDKMFKDVENEVSYADRLILLTTDDYDKIDKEAEKFSKNIIYSNIEKESASQGNTILAVKILLYGFISLVTLIGVTSVFNTINTSINLRRKEFAMLRSIGLTPHGFNKMIWFESLFFGVKSLLYGLPVGLLLSIVISNDMNILVNTNYVPPLGAIIFCIIGVFVIVLITMLYASRKIKKENILEAIREENI